MGLTSDGNVTLINNGSEGMTIQSNQLQVKKADGTGEFFRIWNQGEYTSFEMKDGTQLSTIGRFDTNGGAGNPNTMNIQSFKLAGYSDGEIHLIAEADVNISNTAATSISNINLNSHTDINLTAGASNSSIKTTSTEFNVNNSQFKVLGNEVSIGSGNNLYLSSGSVLSHGSYVSYQSAATSNRHYRIENTDGRRAYLNIDGVNFTGSGSVGTGSLQYDNASGFVSNLSSTSNSHSFNIQNNSKMVVNNNGIFAPVQVGFYPRTTPANSVLAGTGDIYVNNATNNLIYRYNNIDYPIAGPQEPVKIRAFSLPYNTDRFASSNPIYEMSYTLPGNVLFSMSIGWNATTSGGKLEVYTSPKTPSYYASMNIEQSSSTSTNYAVYMGTSTSNFQSFTINSGYIDGDSLVKVFISPTSTTVFSPLLEITIHATEISTVGTEGPYRFIFKQYNEMEMLT
jgi:hypothetical protein